MTKSSSDIAKSVKSRIDSSNSLHRWARSASDPLSELVSEGGSIAVADLAKRYRDSWIVRDTALEVSTVNDGNEKIADVAMYAEEWVVEQLASATSTSFEDCYAKAGILLDRANDGLFFDELTTSSPFSRRNLRLLASLVRDLKRLSEGQQCITSSEKQWFSPRGKWHKDRTP